MARNTPSPPLTATLHLPRPSRGERPARGLWDYQREVEASADGTVRVAVVEEVRLEGSAAAALTALAAATAGLAEANVAVEVVEDYGDLRARVRVSGWEVIGREHPDFSVEDLRRRVVAVHRHREQARAQQAQAQLESLRAQNPGLVITGTLTPAQDTETRRQASVVEALCALQPDLAAVTAADRDPHDGTPARC